MKIYTYSEAQRKLSDIMEEAEKSGKVLIKKKNGRVFALLPEKQMYTIDGSFSKKGGDKNTSKIGKKSSPLNVPTIKANITTQEIVNIIREGREKYRPSKNKK